MDKQINRSTIVKASPEQVSANLTADFEGDSVVLDLRDGVYYELNEVATRVWELVQAPVSVQTILDTLVVEYDVGLEECEADLATLLQDMVSGGLIELRD